MGQMSKQRQTALAVVDAIKRFDTRTVFDLRERNAPREIYPRILGAKTQDDEGMRNVLNMFRNVFRSLDLTIFEMVEDLPARKICIWLHADGQTIAGKYTNDYVWSLHFNETGTKIVRWIEFSDSLSTKRHFPELHGSAEDDDVPELKRDQPLSSSVPTRADSIVSNTSSRSSHSHQSAPSSSSSSRAPPRPRERQEIKGNGRTLGTLG
ncbi:uncharacterized protein J3D65DRAFT_602269 [Phyllosticta citribraziliensis]|uniref:SnoaL-like domain-containing protein n=1 Tax=Phyllosticta citribraziliensis TaxID=989973 RepID=A0ABR1LSU2_9PEZI